VRLVFSKAFRTEAFRQLLIARIIAAGFIPPSPQPCQAWHGHSKVTSSYYEEVRVSRRACERTPFWGRHICAAGGRLIFSNVVEADL
jgi:hypothetical protein